MISQYVALLGVEGSGSGILTDSRWVAGKPLGVSLGLNSVPCTVPLLTYVDDCGTWVEQCPAHHDHHAGATVLRPRSPTRSRETVIFLIRRTPDSKPYLAAGVSRNVARRTRVRHRWER